MYGINSMWLPRLHFLLLLIISHTYLKITNNYHQVSTDFLYDTTRSFRGDCEGTLLSSEMWCRVVLLDRYLCFGSLCFLHINILPWRWRQHVPLRHQYVSAKLHAMAHLKIFITHAALPNWEIYTYNFTTKRYMCICIYISRVGYVVFRQW